MPKTSGMDIVVAWIADDKGLATAGCHHLDPLRLLGSSLASEVGQPSNVLDFDLFL